jgi:hypothetical protein
MTNTTENLALRIAARANEILAERVEHFEEEARYDWTEYEAALAFYNWLRSITFWASADGREVHGMGGTGYGWTYTPVEIGDNACSPFWAELDAAGFEPEWLEPASAHHVLRLW